MANIPHLEKLDLAQLKALAKDVKNAIATAEREQLKKARAAAEEAVKKFGLSLTHVVGGSGKTQRNGASSRPKYMNPDDPEQTWSGRGRQPAWYKSALEKGVKPDDMEV